MSGPASSMFTRGLDAPRTIAALEPRATRAGGAGATDAHPRREGAPETTASPLIDLARSALRLPVWHDN